MISEFSIWDIGLKTKTQNWRKIFIVSIHKAQMDVGLFFGHYFDFLSVKTETQKKRAQFD